MHWEQGKDGSLLLVGSYFLREELIIIIGPKLCDELGMQQGLILKPIVGAYIRVRHISNDLPPPPPPNNIFQSVLIIMK